MERSEFESQYDQESSLLHIVQTSSGVHPTSYTMGTWGSFPGVERSGREADHSPPTSAEVKIMWIYKYTPPYVYRDNFAFTLASHPKTKQVAFDECADLDSPALTNKMNTPDDRW
jgi:hypothetical protein